VGKQHLGQPVLGVYQLYLCHPMNMRLFAACYEEQQCPLGPPWAAQAFMYKVVKPSQVALELLGLEGAQYHARLNINCTKHSFSCAKASLAASEASSPQFRLN